MKNKIKKIFVEKTNDNENHDKMDSSNHKSNFNDESNNISEEQKKKMIEYKTYLNEKCLLSEKEKYVCTYISNIISKHRIDIKVGKTEVIANVIKDNCMHTMKNTSLCDQIIIKIEPV